MLASALILLFVGDQAVLSSLEFVLGVEGFQVADGAAEGARPGAAAALVVDQGRVAQSMRCLTALRAQGCGAPAIVLTTSLTAQVRTQAVAAGAILVEKPLLGEELTRALRATLN